MRQIVIFFYLFLISSNLFAQDIVLNLSATFNDEKIPLDSIKIINNTTNDSIIFSVLPDSVDYSIYMNQGTFVKNNDFDLGEENYFSVIKNVPGSISLQCNNNETSDVEISVYNISGIKVFNTQLNLYTNNSSFSVQIGTGGIYFVRTQTKYNIQTVKCIGFENNTGITVSSILNYQTALKNAKLTTPYRFCLGDEATAIIYKAYYKTQYLSFTVGNSQSFQVPMIRIPQITGGTFFDLRDDREYGYVNIGNQCWMSENLAYKDTSGCWALEDYEPNVNIVGRLYNYESAMRVCPDGWHLPSDEEWSILAEQISIDNGGYEIDITGTWQDVGKHLKAKGTKQNGTGLWKITDEGTEGTDDYGFSAIPAPARYSLSGEFLFYGNLGYYAYWWSSDHYTQNSAWIREIVYNNNDFVRTLSEISFHEALSVRCVKDE